MQPPYALPLLLCGLLAPVASALQVPPSARGIPIHAPPARADFGALAPQALDVRRADFPLHEEQVGGADQRLLGLDAHFDGGCSALWSDERYGIPVQTLGLLGPGGAPVGSPIPVQAALDPLALAPAVSLGPRGAAAVAWSSITPRGVQLVLRLQGRPGAFHTAPLPVGRPLDVPPASPLAQQTPAFEFGREGQSALVWLERGVVHAMRLGADRSPLGPAAPLNLGGLPAQTPPLVELDPTGSLAAVWGDEEGIQAWVNPQKGEVHQFLAGPGLPLAIESDPVSGGFFLLVLDPATRFLELRRLDRQGMFDARSKLVPGPVLRADMALLPEPDLMAIAVERPGPAPDERSRDGAHELHLFLPGGEPLLDEPWDLLPPEARGASDLHLEAGGQRIFTAWTDRRDGDGDVYARAIDPVALVRGEDPGQVHRFNEDRASAQQWQPVVGGNGWRAWTAWIDLRDQLPRIHARAFGQDGQALGAEFALGRAIPAAAPQMLGLPAAQLIVEPALAVDRAGGCLVLWKEARRNGYVLRAQALDASGASSAGAIDLDLEQSVFAEWPAAVTALAGGRGYLALWVRLGQGLCIARISSEGEVVQGPTLLSTGPGSGSARHPAVAQLLDGRLVLAWDTLDPSRIAGLSGLLLEGIDRGGRQRLTMPRSSVVGDQRPALVATDNGGFVLAWTGRLGPQSDVLALPYDRRGRPLGQGIGVSTAPGRQDRARLCALEDGSVIVAWEDSLAGVGLCNARRLRVGGQSGPIVSLHEIESEFLPERVRPELARLGSGWFAVWEDCRRMRGHDAYARFLGPDFDEPAVLDPPPGWPGHVSEDD